MAIVDDLVAHPGLYIGIDSVAGSDLRGAARMVVTLLPGGSGVTLDYESSTRRCHNGSAATSNTRWWRARTTAAR
jgi:hypothetical protein